MIDENKLKKYIMTEINPYGKPFDGTIYEFGNIIMDYIERMEKEPEQKWIPVSERLPEDGCGVLVTVNGKHNNIIFVNALEIAEYRNTEGWIIEGYLDWLDPNVIAWQPLPEPLRRVRKNDRRNQQEL